MIKNIFLFLSLTFLVFTCAENTNYNGLTENEIGIKVYKKNCVSCHGMNGKLQLNGAFDFTLSTLSYEDRVTVIKSGRKLMNAFENVLSEKEIAAVAKFTMKFQKNR